MAATNATQIREYWEEHFPNFHPKEFVPYAIWKRYGWYSIWWIDEKLPVIAQHIRDNIAPSKKVTVRINSRKLGLDSRGYRMPNDSVGSKLSAHKRAQAIDIEVFVDGKEMPADDVRAHILDNEAEYMDMGVTVLEDGAYAPGWCHIDTRWTLMDKIFIVKP